MSKETTRQSLSIISDRDINPKKRKATQLNLSGLSQFSALHHPILAFLLILLLLFCSTVNLSAQQKNKRPKRVILVIADGMGLQHISAGMYKNGDKTSLERCTAVGFHKNLSIDEFISDQAAGATAIACGIMTKNGFIGVDENGLVAENLFEVVQKEGFSTGIITNGSITAPTPAAFYAHVEDIEDKEKIASFLVTQDIDFIVGGGKKYFTKELPEGGSLYEELQNRDYLVSDYEKEQFGQGKINLKTKFCFFTAEEEQESVLKARRELSYASRVAPNFLKVHKDEHFFLLIENVGLIKASKANDTDMIVEEMLHFDKVLDQLITFAEKDKETLIIITSDHETGGFAINPGSTRDSLIGSFVSTTATGVMTPVFAFGPGAKEFMGIYRNMDIHHKIRKVLGL